MCNAAAAHKCAPNFSFLTSAHRHRRHTYCTACDCPLESCPHSRRLTAWASKQAKEERANAKRGPVQRAGAPGRPVFTKIEVRPHSTLALYRIPVSHKMWSRNTFTQKKVYIEHKYNYKDQQQIRRKSAPVIHDASGLRCGSRSRESAPTRRRAARRCARAARRACRVRRQ